MKKNSVNIYISRKFYEVVPCIIHEQSSSPSLCYSENEVKSFLSPEDMFISLRKKYEYIFGFKLNIVQI